MSENKYTCGCAYVLFSPTCPEHINCPVESPMLDPAKQQQSEQVVAHIAEFIPHLMGNFFKRFQAEGFSEGQALELVKTYLHGFAGGKFIT